MQNEMRDKLKDIILQSTQKCDSTDCNTCKYWNTNDCGAVRIADKLIENGVIVPPCEVGDTVYCVDTILKTTQKGKVYGVGFFKDGRIQLYVDDGECICVTGNWYNTKEEAEQKLKGDRDD